MRAHLCIFAKAPMPGRVKTRLALGIGAQAAVHWHRRLVIHTLRQTKGFPGSVELCCAPDPQLDFFQRLTLEFGMARTAQTTGDLGARMAHAAGTALARHEAVILIGTDCPMLDVPYLQAALHSLHRHDVVLGPAQDGGYVLIGLRRHHPHLFQDIDWGSDRVLEQTRRRMHSLHWQWEELPTLWDVDRPEDLARASVIVPDQPQTIA